MIVQINHNAVKEPDSRTGVLYTHGSARAKKKNIEKEKVYFFYPYISLTLATMRVSAQDKAVRRCLLLAA